MIATWEGAGLLAAQAADAVAAALSASWPRSAASREVARLVRDGLRPGAPCDIAFSLAFPEPADALRALAAAQGAGLSATLDDAARGFITVQLRIRLRAWDLARATAWLARIAACFDGYATVVGAVHTTPDAALLHRHDTLARYVM